MYIEGLVTTVGGMRSGWLGSTKVTGQLFSLQDDEWRERRPHLHTARSNPAVVSTCYNGSNYVIVAGGKDGRGDWIASVEILSKDKWYHGTDFPDLLQFPSATVSSTTLYVIDENNFIGYYILLRDLLVDS